MAQRASHLRHAVTPPSLSQAQVPRPRLFEALKSQLDKRLILIAAPAGYGKTTLLAQFGAQADVPVAWARLSETDQDALRLATLVWSSLVKRFRRLRRALNLERLAEASAEGLARAITTTLAERVSDRFVLIIDDVHLINGSEVPLEFLRNLVEQLPPEACMVMAGREVPDIPLVKLIARDEMATLSQEDLALDRTELEAVIQRRLGELPEESVVTRIANETEGWLTGVILSEALLRAKVPTLPLSAPPPTYQYMASAAFDGQPEDTRRFMLGSAVFPVMTAAGCDAVLGRNDSQRMLSHLASKGLFTSVTGTRPKIYEYHHQFRAFLLERGDGELGDELNDLRAKAAAWLEEAGEIEEAVDLYLEADRVDEAAQSANKAAPLLASSGRMQSLALWASDFRRRGIKLPKVYWAYGVAIGDRGYVDEALGWYRLARECTIPSDYPGFFARLLWSFAHASLKQGHIDRARAALDQMREVVRTSDEEGLLSLMVQLEARILWETTGDPRLAADKIEATFTDEMLLSSKTTGILQDHTLYLGYLGEYERAERLCREVMGRARREGSAVREVNSLNNIANCLFYKGEFSDAMEAVSAARDVAHSIGSPHAIVTSEISLGEILIDLGMLGPAANILRSAECYARQIEDADDLCYGFVCQAELAMRRGEFADAARLLARCNEMDVPPYDRELVAMAQLMLRCKTDPQGARSGILAMLRGKPRLGLSKVRCLLGLALTAMARNEGRRSVFWLSLAVDHACRNGFAAILAADLSWNKDLAALGKPFLSHNNGFAQIENLIWSMNRARATHGVNEALRVSTPSLRFEALGPGIAKGDGVDISVLLPRHREILFWLIDQGFGQVEALR